MVTQLTGFTNAVHDAQITFRALLDALARPGLVQTTAGLKPPTGLEASCAAACLTLFDLEATVWLQPGFSAAVRSWLVFHTGCRFTKVPNTADFAVIGQLATAPAFAEFSWGTTEYPEASTSLLIQLPELTGGAAITLQGPGILQTIDVCLPLSTSVWQQWQKMTEDYPLGLDCWYFAQNQVVGMPRTTKLVSKLQEAL